MAEARKHDVEQIVRDLGADWGRAIQDQIVEAGAAHARVLLESGKYNRAENSIEVTIPVWLKLSFPLRDGQVVAGDAGVSCSCTLKPGVCICVGPGAGSCDCDVAMLPSE